MSVHLSVAAINEQRVIEGRRPVRACVDCPDQAVDEAVKLVASESARLRLILNQPGKAMATLRDMLEILSRHMAGPLCTP